MIGFIENLKAWFKVKIQLQTKGTFYNIREGDVWWCAFGQNVGVEINGKNNTFSRPVVVLKKLSNLGFLGVPLTSQHHTGSWYTPFIFHDKQEYAVLSQIRVLSIHRLYKKMGMISTADFNLIKNGLLELYFRKNVP